MIPLIVGTVLTLSALAYVLYPLLVSLPPGQPDLRSETHAVSSVKSGNDTAVDALREIEFDRATGKLSDADYGSLKASYTQRAVSAMRMSANPVCSNCGPRPESEAAFCSQCGTALA